MIFSPRAQPEVNEMNHISTGRLKITGLSFSHGRGFQNCGVKHW